MDSDEEAGQMDNTSELELMSREWNKICEHRYKDGFVSGSTVGQNKLLQKAFNAGFKQGFLSNFLLSKMRGILSALLAYQNSYEGNPITDATLLETHSLLEEIETLETNAVAEDFIKMSLHQNNQSQTFQDDLINSFSTSTTLQSSSTSRGIVDTTRPQNMEDENSPQMGANLDLDAVNSLSIKEVNELLLKCPQIVTCVNRCKRILKSLNWTDEMIDNLL